MQKRRFTMKISRGKSFIDNWLPDKPQSTRKYNSLPKGYRLRAYFADRIVDELDLCKQTVHSLGPCSEPEYGLFEVHKRRALGP